MRAYALFTHHELVSFSILQIEFLRVSQDKKGFSMETKERRVGTVSRGIRCPIIRQGDNLAELVSNSVLEAAEIEGFEMNDRDVIAITESIVAPIAYIAVIQGDMLLTKSFRFSKRVIALDKGVLDISTNKEAVAIFVTNPITPSVA